MEHSFDIKIAEKYGVNIAIIVKNFDFWLSKNKANNNNFKDGTWWTYNSIKAFSQLFPYFTERQINHTLKKMTELKIIETGVYNNNSYDRTKWYTFTKQFTKEHSSILQFCQIENTEVSNETDRNVKSLYTDNKPDNKPDIKDNDFIKYKNGLFDVWYDKYDKKVSKEKALKIWDKLSIEDMRLCLLTINKYIMSTPDKQFRKNPDTYLRNKCWKDEIIIKDQNKIQKVESRYQNEIPDLI